jgi:uncharacterized protein (TIGR02996 family)
MESQRQAFIREIVSQPDDDTPRLIYADWLEELGDPQGEFIRVQCELARPCDAERRRALVDRERELLAEHRDAWLAPLGPGLIRGRFKRGVLEQIEVEPDSFLANHRQWFREYPILALQVKLSRIEVQPFAAIPHLRQLRTLRLSESDLSEGGWLRLFDSPNLGSLDELWLRAKGIDSIALAWIMKRPLARSLKVLLLSGNPIGDEGAEILRTASLPSLESLFITSCEISRDVYVNLKWQLRGVAISY